MPKTPKFFAETTFNLQMPGVIDDVLRSLRIEGSLLLREPYVSPWSVAVPDSCSLAGVLGKGPAVRVVAFHLVEYGHCRVKLENGTEHLLKAGEMAICFGGSAHRLFQGDSAKTQSIESLLAGGSNIHRPGLEINAGDTALLCGVFMLSHTEFNPLVAALPSMMLSNLSRPGELHNLSGVARLMAEEIDRNSFGGDYIVERLLEVLCAEAIRTYIETVPQRETGWLRGIKDPVVGRAIAAVHSCPDMDWSVQRMAQGVAMSPSRFAARFSECVGDSPMAYVTKWRMNIACRELASTQKRVDQIAVEVGYESLAAFSRAFKKHVNVSPAMWRDQLRTKPNCP